MKMPELTLGPVWNCQWKLATAFSWVTIFNCLEWKRTIIIDKYVGSLAAIDECKAQWSGTDSYGCNRPPHHDFLRPGWVDH